MSVEMMSLALSTLLLLLLVLIAASLHIQQAGFKAVMGNREAVAEPSGIAGRARRAHANLLENLLPFAVAVLMAQALGVSSSYTVAGAWLFLGGRVAHGVFYLLGVTVLRTLAFFTGLAGIALILVPLLFR
ncbi:MAPEG family protein [Gallaecimonas xiamenensis]|uniref:MAPEG family protein n=1 Tax=Gallaecimonas xiamenensis 3-C-1 TaxID=745411 RepID=K2JGX8_9GAMM|nr:MAPEG family protein [Gallaecimonas xiamenensis]EKE69914.1 hypothetical protein B3C1_14540 [Gallaecimonas xiamenensis 3-C-1]